MVGEKGERNKKRRDIATAGVKLMKGCNKKKVTRQSNVGKTGP